MNKSFENKVNQMFEDKLGYDEISIIRVKDVQKNEILSEKKINLTKKNL